MSFCLGIDLGTTNTVVSYVQRGQLELLTFDGSPLLPSAVSLKPDGSWLVGKAAKDRAIVAPDVTFTSSKRDLGKEVQYYIPHSVLMPQDIARMILQRVREVAQATLGPVNDAVITVPAYFDEEQRKLTKEAGEAAGFRVLRILPEPTAAAIAYGIDRRRDQTLAVYDLGGGTFDVSVIRVAGNDFKVLAVGGDTNLGGDDFDTLVMDWILESAQVDLSLVPPRKAQADRQKLKDCAERAKIELSESPTANILLPDLGGKPVQLELDRSTFGNLIAPLVARTIDILQKTLEQGRVPADSVDRIILVGGSTRNPLVRAKVTEAVREPFIAPSVDLVVSHGAALVGASLFSPIESGIEVSEVTAHSLGTDCRRDEELIVDHVIPAQTPYPCKRARLYYARPGQTSVPSDVFRGESTQPEECVRLGHLTLSIRKPSPDQFTPIAVIFELDRDGIIHFTCAEFPYDEHSKHLIEYANQNQGNLVVEILEKHLAAGHGQIEKISVTS